MFFFNGQFKQKLVSRLYPEECLERFRETTDPDNIGHYVGAKHILSRIQGHTVYLRKRTIYNNSFQKIVKCSIYDNEVGSVICISSCINKFSSIFLDVFFVILSIAGGFLTYHAIADGRWSVALSPTCMMITFYLMTRLGVRLSGDDDEEIIIFVNAIMKN